MHVIGCIFQGGQRETMRYDNDEACTRRVQKLITGRYLGTITMWSYFRYGNFGK